MRHEDTLLQSFLKGIIISCVLILFQIIFSPGSTNDSHVKFVKYENNSNLPVDTKEETTFAIKSYSLPSTGCIEVCRETLCIFEILFSVEISLNQDRISVPLPILSYLHTLFTSVISVNAP